MRPVEGESGEERFLAIGVVCDGRFRLLGSPVLRMVLEIRPRRSGIEWLPSGRSGLRHPLGELDVVTVLKEARSRNVRS